MYKVNSGKCCGTCKHIAKDSCSYKLRVTHKIGLCENWEKVSLDESPLWHLGLDIYEEHALLSAGIQTVGDVSRLTVDKLLGIHNIGEKRAKRIFNLLRHYLENAQPE